MTLQAETSDARDILTRIDRSLREIDRKISILIRNQSKKGVSRKLPLDLVLDVDTLLSLPDHLRKSAMTISELGEATAEMVAGKTGRTRAAESDYLNQLVIQRVLKKKRKGRDVYFFVEE